MNLLNFVTQAKTIGAALRTLWDATQHLGPPSDEAAIEANPVVIAGGHFYG